MDLRLNWMIFFLLLLLLKLKKKNVYNFKFNIVYVIKYFRENVIFLLRNDDVFFFFFIY